ncbi:MAG: DNA mismatch repair endonuclease MutL [Planctomycetota bacterium]
MAPIRVLPIDVQNRIAAGEVIERPASVLKELVENALDAGARHLQVLIHAGGRELIRVHDDGEGIAAEDLPVAVLRHATSKITSAADIYTVESLGFRGEALPSIASVSLLTIVSRRRQDDSAAAIHIDGGAASPVEMASGNPGTTVTVRRLFYNLPARLKFLKSEPSETAACLQMLTRLALAWPQCAFQLKVRAANGRDKVLLDVTAQLPLIAPAGSSALRRAVSADTAEPLASSPASPASSSSSAPAQSAPVPPPSVEMLTARRLEELFGDDDAGMLSPFSGFSGEPNTPGFLHLTGFAGAPALRHPNRTRIQLFLNRRPIKDAALTAAVCDAYRGLLPDRTFPVVFLFLKIDPSEIDVNVHPTKEMIRFRDPGRLYGFIKQTLEHANRRRDLAPAAPNVSSVPPLAGASTSAPAVPAALPARLTSPAAAPPAPLPFSYPAAPGAAPRRFDPRALTDRIPTAPAPSPTAPVPSPTDRSGGYADRIPFTAGVTPTQARETAPAYAPPPHAASPAADASLDFVADSGSTPHAAAEPAAEPAAAPAPSETFIPTPWRAIGQWAQAFILAEAGEKLFVIDQHALHERLMFERFRRQVEHGPLDAEPFLLPQPLRLTPVQRAVTDAVVRPLADLGLRIEPFGADTVLLRSAPVGVPADLAGRVVVECLDEVLEQNLPRADRMTLRRKLVNRMSCIAAIKAGDPLSLAQMQALLDEYAQVVGVAAFTCPHGRPIAMEIKRDAVERAVGRG